MRTALDTNVLSVVWSKAPVASQLAARLQEAQREGVLILCAATYAESLAHPDYSETEVQAYLRKTEIQVDFAMSEEVWREAGRRYALYARRRRRSAQSGPRRILADFIVGAHALLHADRLMTFDQNHFELNFPELTLYPIEE